MSRLDTSREWRRRRFNRARDRELADADAEQVSALRWRWREACTASPLGRMIYTPSGVSTAIPLIGRVDLGPPINFTVQMRPGQTFEDFVKAAPSIASAMDVPRLEVAPFVPHWVRIVIVME